MARNGVIPHLSNYCPLTKTSSIARNLNDKTIFRSHLTLSEKLVSHPLTSRVAQSICEMPNSIRASSAERELVHQMVYSTVSVS